MKIRIREGNDFDVAWAIKRGGVPEDLSTAINMKLTLVVYGLVIEHSLFTVTDNVLSINIPKEVATVNGDYRLIFEYTLPDAGQPDGDLKCKTDVVPFRIVPFTAKADDIYTINVTSDIAIGLKGDKGDDGDDAYQIWLDLGNEGTYEDFIAYLRQPAVDAGASISELEGEIQVSEGLRVQAETARANAEGDATKGRVKAESERVAAEGERAQAFAQIMGEADDKIEEMDTTISTYDGRVTQVESDISQLAGDKVDKSAVKQIIGTSETDVMSQKAVTDELTNLRSELYQWIGVESEVLSYATSLITPISINQVKRIDTLTKGLKTRLAVSNLSDIFDVLYIHANETQESALRNLAKNAHHATTSAITFEPYRGLKGNKTSHFVDTNYNPSTAINYKQDSACMGGYTYVQDTNTIGNACVYWGVENTTNYVRFIPHRDSILFWQINSAVSTNISSNKSSPDRALHIQNRVAAGESKLYKNGQLYDTHSLASNGIPNGNVYLFARNETGTGASLFTDAGLSCWFAGKGLTEAQIAIINDEIEKYMISISNNFMVNITTPTVIFTFDDGNAEHATLTKSVFDTYGKKCTHFIVSDFIGQAGFMTVADMQMLHSVGYDLQCHSKDHSNFSTLTETQLVEQFEAVNTLFSTAGLPLPKHHAYPGGVGYNYTLVLNTIYRHRQSARRIGNVDICYSGYVMPEYAIATARSIDTQTGASTMNASIDIAKANNGVVIFYGHGVYENDPSESAYPNPVKAQALRDAIAYAIAQGVEVKTYSEVFDRDNW